MSYVIGYKTRKSVFLAADSAITVDEPLDHYRPTLSQRGSTSFGELNISTPNVSVYEGILKIINLGSAAIAMCGDVSLCRSVIGKLKEALSQINDPRKALRIAISDNGPLSDGPAREIGLLMAFPQSPTPVLLSYNADGYKRIIEIDDNFLVQMGSLEDKFKSITPQMISELKMFHAEPHRYLVGCLAFLQSYGIHNYVLEHGVGGTFCGLLTGEDEIEWQKDILFCLHNGRDPNIHMVSSIIRDHVHVVRSNITNSCRYFGDSINEGLSSSWRVKWWDQAFEYIKGGQFDFIVLLNTQYKIITVVEMLKQRKSQYLRIRPSPPLGPDESFRLDLALSPLLTKAMVEPIENRHDGSFPVKFNWFPFQDG
jgi:hypothetical protein